MVLGLSLRLFWVILSHLKLLLPFLKSQNAISWHEEPWKSNHLDLIFWAQKSRFSVRHGGLCSKSSKESLLHQNHRSFKALHARKMRFGTLKTAKVVLNNSKWPRNTLVTILKPYLDFIFWTQKSRFSVRRGGLSSKSPLTVMLPWLTSLQELRIVTKITFGTLKSLKMSLTYPKWPRNTLITILDTYLDSILEVKKSTFPVRHRGLSPPQGTTPYC